ncbi:putative Rdx family [Trypanosoma vivax]|uniref:Uncharacterized protein n=1 Tax=Trypanosoma vivax (strain Y486) TaxID=1055687 RepID=G0TV69_TRYVY|nr:hypothetical protein TRVL_09624 [Trypanosoma vivax]KAH8613720.1 putative Rdx family [Trypanosoma vivax]CCC47835.1 conserved hypothetical protein [Trypanosoma vivax Y486]
MISNLLSAFFVVSLALSFVPSILSMVLPVTIMARLQSHRTAVLIAGFILNMVAANLTQSGAFEVYLDGNLVYSKLESGVVPRAEALAEFIVQKLIEASAT